MHEIPGFFAPLLLLANAPSSGFYTAVFLEINESCNIAQPELALRHIFKITINGH